MCKWQSEYRGSTIECRRGNYQGSDYCLFHKSGKKPDEAILFWKVINWDNYKLLNDREIQIALSPWLDEEIDESELKIIDDKISRSIMLNFTKKERERDDFEDFSSIIKKELRNANINKSHNTAMIDFIGFVFPDYEISYFNYKLYNVGTFVQLMDFSNSVFEGHIMFDNYNFNIGTSFDNCTFKLSVSFRNSSFNGSTYFRNTKFSNHNMGHQGKFHGTNFNGREVCFSNNNIDGCSRLNLHGIQFGPYTNIDLTKMNFCKEFGTASHGEIAYRIAKNQCNRIGDCNTSAFYYYLEKCFAGYQIFPQPYFWDKSSCGFKKIFFFKYIKRDKPYKYLFPKIMDLIARISIGYGEKPGNALITSLILIFFFALLYMYTGSIAIDGAVINYDFNISTNIMSIPHWRRSFLI